MAHAPPAPADDGDALHPAAIVRRIARWTTDGVQGPLTLELYPTLRCNLDCAFCDTTDRHRPPMDELSADRLLQIVDEAADLGVKRVFVLGGGEPFARRDAIGPLLRRIKDRGMEGVLTTNGTLIGADMARQLAETGWDEVHVSIDGPDAAIHDALRGRAGSFRKAVATCCRLSVERRRNGRATPRVAIHFVLTRRNWTTLPAMVRLAHAVGAFRIDFDALIAYTPEQLDLRLSPQDMARVAQVAAEAMKIARDLGITTTLEHLLEPERIGRGISAPPSSTAPPATSPGLAAAPCLRAWHYITVQADGRVSPCCVLAGMGGSVADQPLADVWRLDPFMEQVRDTMSRGRPLDRCRECSWNILSHEALISAHLTQMLEGP